MILKIISSAAIIASATALGVQYASRYGLRAKEIRAFQSALVQLESEILYYDTLLPDALMEIGALTEGEVGKFFTEAGRRLKSKRGQTIDDAWRKALDHSRQNLNLTQEDYELILDFGGQLGLSDKEGLRKYFQLIQSRLKNQEAKAEEERNRYEKMAKSLGLLGGLAIAIILL
mgnify:CR=1 FL=1